MLQITKYTHVSPVHSENERKIIRVYVTRSLCGFLFLFSCGLKYFSVLRSLALLSSHTASFGFIIISDITVFSINLTNFFLFANDIITHFLLKVNHADISKS